MVIFPPPKPKVKKRNEKKSEKTAVKIAIDAAEKCSKRSEGQRGTGSERAPLVTALIPFNRECLCTQPLHHDLRRTIMRTLLQCLAHFMRGVCETLNQ